MAQQRNKARRLRFTVQLLSLGLFIYLLVQAAWPAAGSFLPPDFFLRLDPLVSLALPLAAREFIYRLLPGLIFLAGALLIGRFFCGHICPFGITLDLIQKIRGFFGRPLQAGGGRSAAYGLKYLILAAIIGAALWGFNLLFWTAPIPLITRLYALVFYPAVSAGADSFLHLGRPLFESLGFSGAAYATVQVRAFDSLLFLGLFFALIFGLEWQRPRFWCRFLCPAGAVLALVSKKPLWRRRVSGCVNCGLCARRCPASAISPDGCSCRHGECLTCRLCVDLCPAEALSFGFCGSADKAEGQISPLLFPRLSRRAFLGSAAAGVGLSIAFPFLAPKTSAAALVRPPGARPEADFLTLCLRCGECMKACPSNGLAPAGLRGGFEALFSPYLLARRGPCEPDCHRCGELCPTGALADLPLTEKQWAKIGTALVLKETCLAWAEDRRCVVCQEVCPYAAIDLKQTDGASIPVPIVRADRCYGCGYCEYHCPVDRPAIIVEAAGALRLGPNDSYHQRARVQGLELDPAERPEVHEELSAEELPPGFIDLD